MEERPALIEARARRDLIEKRVEGRIAEPGEVTRRAGSEGAREQNLRVRVGDVSKQDQRIDVLDDLAVVEGVVDLIELHVDANPLQLVLHKHHHLAVVVALADDHGQLEPATVARFRQQLLRPIRIMPAAQSLREGFGRRGSEIGGAHHCDGGRGDRPKERAQVRAVDREANCLANSDVVERLHAGVDVKPPIDLGSLAVDDEALLGQTVYDLSVERGADAVDFAGSQCKLTRSRARHEAHDDLIEMRLACPVGIVAHHHDAVLRHVFLEAEGAGANGAEAHGSRAPASRKPSCIPSARRIPYRWRRRQGRTDRAI